MSKQGNVQPNVLHDVQTMSDDELEINYSIEIDEDGSVYDTLEGKEFDSLTSWAMYTNDVNLNAQHSKYDKIKNKYGFDDD